jgi:hypothetical protein
VSAAPKATVQSIWTDLSRQLSYIFFNAAPTADPYVNGQEGEDKEITVDLNAQSNNGFPLTYRLKTPPKYGKVSIDQATGKAVYTPDDAFIKPGISDTFTITVDNGASAALPGFVGFVQLTLHTLAVSLGIAKPDTIDRQVAVTVTGTGQYGGDVTQLAKLHAEQSYWNCVLMASAMAAAQVTKTQTLPQDTVVAWAKELDSVVVPGSKMFLSERVEQGAYPVDAVVLMEKHYPVTAVNTVYATYDANGKRIAGATPADARRALNDLNAALAQGKAISVFINNDALYSSRPDASKPPWTPENENTDFTTPNHQVQVLNVDMSAGKVWVNDSALTTGGVSYPLSGFMTAWQASDYDLTVVSAKTPV